MIRRSIIVVSLAMAICLASLPAGAQLSPVSWGFPNIVHSASATNYVQDLADATNFQDVSIGYGGAWSFPCIHQTSLQTQSMSHTEFSQTSEFDAIGYPYVSVGGPMSGFVCC